PGGTRRHKSFALNVAARLPSAMQTTGRPDARYSPSLEGNDVSPKPLLSGRTNASASSSHLGTSSWLIGPSRKSTFLMFFSFKDRLMLPASSPAPAIVNRKSLSDSSLLAASTRVGKSLEGLSVPKYMM